MLPAEAREHVPHSCNQPRRMLRILFAPGAVGIIPSSPRQLGGTIYVVPVRRIVPGEILQAPGDSHFAEHCEVSRRIRLVGIKERAVPIEEHALDRADSSCGHHWSA